MERNVKVLERLGKCSPLVLVGVLCLVFQYLAIFYVNLTDISYFMGYDASAYFVLANEIVLQRTLFVEDFAYTTTLLWDSPLLFALVFRLFLKDLFLCYGLANCVTVVLISGVLYCLTCQLGLKTEGKLLTFILFFTPYVSAYYTPNDLGYGSMLFYSMGAYGLKLPICLFLIHLFVEWDEKGVVKTSVWKYACGFFFLFLTSVSSGFYVFLFGVVPLIVFVFLRGLWEDQWGKAHHQSVFFLVFATFTAVLGKWFCHGVLGFDSMDSDVIWISLPLFFDNVQSIFLGFCQLIGVFPYENGLSVLSYEGILYGIRFLFLLLLLGLSGWSCFRKKSNETIFMVIRSVIFCHLLIFTLLYTTYGSVLFETRYLIPMVVMFFLLAAFSFEELLHGKNQSLKGFVVVSLGASLVVMNLSSYQHLSENKTDYGYLKEITEICGEYSGDIVYISGKTEYLQVLAANLRAVDFSKVYKYSHDLKTANHWGDYLHYDENGSYQGDVMLLTTPDYFDLLDPVFRGNFVAEHTFPLYDLTLYRGLAHKVDLVGGISDCEVSRDFMYSPSVTVNTNLGYFTDGGTFRTVGVGGYVCSSEFTVDFPVYGDFELNYFGFENENQNLLGEFAVQVGEEVYRVGLDSNYQKVVIPQVDLRDKVGETVVYSVSVDEGAEIILESVCFVRNYEDSE